MSTIQPSVSRRVSLRFLPSPPSEPTDTLVLTAGVLPPSTSRNFFVDFRPFSDDPSKCEWAFAGYKIRPEADKSRWIHLIDSRGADWEGEDGREDSGIFETLPNGDDLERGEMLDPASGKIRPYEEVWRDDPLPSDVEVLVALTEDEGGVNGMVVRIGEWIQGVLRTSPDEVVASRQHQTASGWTLEASYGQHNAIPGDALQGRQEGDRLVHKGRTWAIALNYIHRG